jgi:general nucleoside transport system permease protein
VEVNLILATILAAVPIALAALGGVLSERAGVINFALEGMMLSGAFAAVTASYYMGSPYLALAAAVVAGTAIAFLHAATSLWLRVNQIISSIAINLFALGLTGALLWRLFGQGTTPEVATLPMYSIHGVAFNALMPVPFILAPIVWAFLRFSTAGLHLRAAGEDAAAARSAGVRVMRVKSLAVLASGALAGAAGAFISIGVLSTFTMNMTNGRGYIAVAAVIFGKWNPLGAVGAALLFGLFATGSDALAASMGMPAECFHALPYVLTLVALAGFVGKTKPPGDIGDVKSAAESGA